MNYKIEKSTSPNKWVCTDLTNKIVCVFEDKKFNETQKMTELEDFNNSDFMKIPTIMREMGDWLFENHKEKLF